jgi:phospholipid-binding lipoprotein MlaA
MDFRWSRAVLLTLMMGVAAGLGGCSSTPKGSETGPAVAEDNDPWEPVNRKIWALDLALDQAFFKPVAKGYRDYTPQFAQTGVTNALRNLRSPAIFANDLLQGNTDRAGQTLARITLNTVFGLGGFVDVAGKHGIPFHDADFGQTLGAWGVGPGPYLVLPLLGPSDPRDGIGYGVDSFADPFSIKMRASGYDDPEYIRWGMNVVSDRAATIDQLDAVKRESLDFYAAIRSLYQQQRAAAVATAKHGGEANFTPDLPAEVVPEEGPVPSHPPAPKSDKTK